MRGIKISRTLRPVQMPRRPRPQPSTPILSSCSMTSLRLRRKSTRRRKRRRPPDKGREQVLSSSTILRESRKLQARSSGPPLPPRRAQARSISKDSRMAVLANFVRKEKPVSQRACSRSTSRSSTSIKNSCCLPTPRPTEDKKRTSQPISSTSNWSGDVRRTRAMQRRHSILMSKSGQVTRPVAGAMSISSRPERFSVAATRRKAPSLLCSLMKAMSLTIARMLRCMRGCCKFRSSGTRRCHRFRSS
mmetsp:Transcript_58036/g.188912  ORF Transcript_58036/g.188912 Transcript_58036/m.188912 type:complete len:247 (+) Transcript_58036:848-1588(+)